MSLTKVTYSMVSGAPANILDFGAVGNGINDDTAAIQAALNSGATIVEVPVCANFYNVTAPIKIPRGVALRGHMMAGTIGIQVQSTKPRIEKTTNTTVGIPRYEDSVVVQRDCVFYSEYLFEDGFYPQNFEINGLFIGKATANTGSIGIYHEEGSNWLVEDCYIYNVEHGFYARNIWISRFSNLRLASKFTVEIGGTSCVLTNCTSNGSSTGYDGFNVRGLSYSTFNACTSDNGLNPAFSLDFCSGISFINCGCESNTYVSTNQGWGINFKGGNTATVIGFVSVAKAASTTPIFAVTSDDNVIFQSCTLHNGRTSAPGMQDIYVKFKSNVLFDNCLFAITGGVYIYDVAVLGFNSTDARVIIRAGEIAKTYYPTINQSYARTQYGYTAGAVTTLNQARYYGKSISTYGGATFRSDSDSLASLTWFHLYGTSSGNTVLNIAIYGNGNIQNANNSYGAVSDIKLKENITDASLKLSDILKVRVVNFNLKSDPSNKQIGVIAQELEEIFPAMVEEVSDIDAEGNALETTTKSVKYSVFVPILIKAIQELNLKFETFKATQP